MSTTDTPFFYIEAAQCPPQTSDPPLTPQTFSGRGAKPQCSHKASRTQSQPPVRPLKHAQTAAGCGTCATGATGQAAARAASCAARRTLCGRTDGGDKGAPGKRVQAVQLGQGVNFLGMASNGGVSSCALESSLHACLQQPLQSPPPPARAAYPFPSCLSERSNAHR